MQIDWVNVLANITLGSIVVSAIAGAGSALAYGIMQVRQARTAEVIVERETKE